MNLRTITAADISALTSETGFVALDYDMLTHEVARPAEAEGRAPCIVVRGVTFDLDHTYVLDLSADPEISALALRNSAAADLALIAPHG